METEARIYIAGEQTLIGAALRRQLKRQGYANVVTGPNDHELADGARVDSFFSAVAPEYVFLTAGRSGGIRANQKYPAELMLDNLLVQCHLIHNSFRYRVKKLIYLASSCTYPVESPQPMRVEKLLTGLLEPSSEAYAVAKIAGIKLCQAYRQQYGAEFITAIPADTFGPGDDFSLEDSHVVAALIRKMHEAKESRSVSVEVWGSGNPMREFIFVDDLADACIFTMRNYHAPEPINLGSGFQISIGQLAEEVRSVVGYPGRLQFDATKPDGMPAKLLDSSRLAELGWKPNTALRSALAATYDWFLRQH